MVQNSIIVVTPAPPPHTSTFSLPSRITYSLPISATYVSPHARKTRVPYTYPSLTTSLLPSADTKYFPSTPPIIPPTPDLRHLFHTFTLSLILGPVSSSFPLFNSSNLPMSDPISEPSYIPFFITLPPPP